MSFSPPPRSPEQMLQLLDTHPFFTGCCPQCDYSLLRDPPCIGIAPDAAGWMIRCDGGDATMRAREILQLYAAGERDFRDTNLRGQSFKGKDLSAADFSGADIRSTDFTNAYLKGTKFVGAKAGLSRRWAVFLVAMSWLLAAVSSLFLWFLAIVIALIFSNDLQQIVPGWLVLITTGLFYIVSSRRGLGSGAFCGAIAFAAVFAVAFAATIVFAVATAFARVPAIAELFSTVGVSAAIIPIALAIAIAAVIAVTVAIASAGVIATAVAVTIAIATAVAVAVSIAVAVTAALAGAIATVIALVILNAYLGWRALRGYPKDAWLRSVAIAFSTIGGTSFRNGDLTDADFSNATLKSTDLRKATLTRTCWKNAEKLDRIRPGTTYLHNPEILQLVRTGEGKNKDFNRLTLQGINLQGANLIGVSFIEANLNEANLQDANLTDAKLVHAQLDRADLTGATLTGAYLEEWNITTDTKLNGIRCDYVFMRLPPDKRPAFIALSPEESRDPNPRRKPDDWDKNFEEGEFAEFIEPMRLTLDLYHNRVVDPRLVAIAFGQLKEDNPDAQIEAIAIEKKGANRDKLLVRAETSPNADRSALHSEYFTNFSYLESLSPEQQAALLRERGEVMRFLLANQKPPDVSINNNSNNSLAQEDNNMTGENTIKYHKDNRDLRESSGDIIENVGRDSVRGNVNNTTYHQDGNFGIGHMSGGEIKEGAKVAGVINEAQQQDLSAAATEIQQLLEQLALTHPTETLSQQAVVAESAIAQIEDDPTWKQRVIAAIKAMGVEAFMELIDHPVANVLRAGVEKWKEPN